MRRTKEPKRRNVRAVEAEGTPELSANYDKSWAIVVGINHYEHFNGLERANQDATGMAKLLMDRLGFPQDNVFLVLDPPPDDLPAHLAVFSRRATKTVLEDLILNRLPELAGENDRVLIFYAGHGDRRIVRQARLDNVGYLVPSDAVPGQWHTFVEWDAIMRAGDYCRAKHIFYLLDACYSGIAASRAAVSASRFSDDMLKARVREVLTAGTAKQAVADTGPGGHSLFTSYLLEGLGGAAAIFDKSMITASELMVYVRHRVAPAKDSKQTPAFSTLDTEPGGDFVFVLPPHKKPSSDLSKRVKIVGDPEHGVPVSYAVVNAMHASLRWQGTPAQLSPQKLVELGRVLNPDIAQSGGELVSTIINAAQAFGVPVEKLEARNKQARASAGSGKIDKSIPDATCNARCTRLEKVDEIPDQLAQGHPVVMGLGWFESFYQAKHGALEMPPKNAAVLGFTAVAIVGYDANLDTFRYISPWGVTWGDRGLGAIKRDVLAYCAGAHADIWAVEAKLYVWRT
jgi:Caspase domain